MAYTLPTGTTAVPGQRILSTRYNAAMNSIAAALNLRREATEIQPAQYGGTGKDTSALSGLVTWGTGTPYFDSTIRSLRSFGAAIDGGTNDTVAWNSAIAWLNAAMYRCLILPAGQTLVTAGALDPITQSNVSVLGMGSGASRILVTGSGVGLQIGRTPPVTGSSQYIYNPVLRGIGIFKSGSGTVTALKIVAPEHGIFDDLTCYTGSTAPTGDIGLDLYGRADNSFSNLYCQSDLPLRMSTASATAGDGIDHTTFHNLTLFSETNLNPLILVTPGTAVGNISFTGKQIWIGGNAGFYFVDPAPTGNSGTLVFDNIRREDNTEAATRTSGFSVHTDLGDGYSVFGIYSRNCRFTAGPNIGYRMDGFKIHGNYVRLVVEGFTSGGGTGEVFLDTSSPGAYTDSIVLLNSTWGNGTITTTNMAEAGSIGVSVYGAGVQVYTYLYGATQGLKAAGASGAGGYLHPFWLGTYAMWIASDGKLYIKNGTPVSDFDGTVVGSQA